MLVDTIQAELARLQLHPANLSVSSKDDRSVALQGSLLRYWELPPHLDGRWLLSQLQGLRDAAGAQAVMNGLVAAYSNESMTTIASKTGTQLHLFDPQNKTPEK